MKNRERFVKTLNFQPVDRLPVIEWASWWDQTIQRWHNEGLPESLTSDEEIRDFFGLDPHRQYWISPRSAQCPAPSSYGQSIISDRDDYIALKKYLYPHPAFDEKLVESWAKMQAKDDLVVWITLEGFFWYPRTLFGIEPHMYAFFDHPDLMKEMNQDLLEFNMKVFDEFCSICVPDFMTIAEDMSYNHGPMLSKAQFDEFMAPYYEALTPILRDRGTIVFVDTDGDVTIPAQWLTDVGVQGLLPLERMAGVDVVKLREAHPKLRMIGAFDKTVMHLGEGRIRREFERLFPVMRQGGYIPGVDHQTPPQVSLDQYQLYLRLLREYCEKAAKTEYLARDEVSGSDAPSTKSF